MAERLAIRLDDSDLIAAAQILSWIAWPHRPDHGVSLLNHWFLARRRLRGETVPPLPIKLKKNSRLEVQLFGTETRRGGLEGALLKAMVAGRWFDFKLMSGSNRPLPMLQNWQASTRGLALQRAAKREDGGQQPNEIRAIWTKRRPVAHLASSFEKAVTQLHDAEGKKHFDLEMMAFHPVWVPEAIKSAESAVRIAEVFGAFQPGQFYRFHRDTF